MIENFCLVILDLHAPGSLLVSKAGPLAMRTSASLLMQPMFKKKKRSLLLDSRILHPSRVTTNKTEKKKTKPGKKTKN
jgi:hypothetical protein